MKKTALILVLLLLLTACDDKNAAGSPSETNNIPSGTMESVADKPDEPATETEAEASSDAETEETTETGEITAAPTTNDELFSYFLQEWKKGDVSTLYPYASYVLKSMLGEEDFQYMFCDSLSSFGRIVDVDNLEHRDTNTQATYTGTVHFENASALFQLHLDNLQIAGYYYDLRIEKPFDVTMSNGVTEHYFLLQNGDCQLNAVYVKAAQENAPVALLIPGSGPTDYNETIGILPTFRDLAEKLANNGVSSLRFEKRTIRYASEIKNTDGLDEEYFSDLEAALSWLSKEAPSSDVWYLGHSLGANIAAELCDRHPAAGMILWNGSARHLAEIAADQYGEQSSAAREFYAGMAKNAMAVTEASADGTNYFTCSDYYWASYNKLDSIGSIRSAKVPTLILNSLLDRQLYEADRALWQDKLGNEAFVKIHVFDDMSHFGYKIDAQTSSYYHLSAFPDELVSEITGFIMQ